MTHATTSLLFPVLYIVTIASHYSLFCFVGGNFFPFEMILLALLFPRSGSRTLHQCIHHFLAALQFRIAKSGHSWIIGGAWISENWKEMTLKVTRCVGFNKNLCCKQINWFIFIMFSQQGFPAVKRHPEVNAEVGCWRSVVAQYGGFLIGRPALYLNLLISK